MKKLLGMTFVALFMMSASPLRINCASYAQASCIYESQHYGAMSQSEYAQAYTFYYNACVDAEGNIGAPVIIN